MIVDFCLPVKNEEKILKKNINYLLKFLEHEEFDYSWKIVIIVNDSQDNSYSIAKGLESLDSRIVLKHLKESGKGLALKEYFKESSADVLVFMDIDLAVSLNDIPNLLYPILNNKVDLVFGSRLLPESHLKRSIFRTFISKIYNNLSRLILKHSFSDLQCGFKAFKKELFIDLQKMFRDNNWFFDTELIILASRRGYKIKEIPINWQEDRYDQRKSKVRILKDSWTFLRNLLSFRKYLLKNKDKLEK